VDAYEWTPNITLPHWPSNSVPATGSDGHCDIVDNTTGILHSFWQLSKFNGTGRWIAQQYAWSPLNGVGFGDPAHFYQGARATGVPTSGGLIRIHEVHDGLPTYPHALALSMSAHGLSKNPTYIYPATTADSDAATANDGPFPEGSLVMLPSTFVTSTIASVDLRKVAETLKVYGAYVVDKNYETPFAIYVENNSSFRMSNLSWDNAVASELQTIRAALRMVISASKYLDGNNNTLVAPTKVNLLSMRGPNSWIRQSGGDANVRYDTWSQSLVYDGSNTKNTTHQNWSKLGYNNVAWGKLIATKVYTFSVTATGGAKLSIIIQVNSVTVYTSPALASGQSVNFTYPLNGVIALSAFKPAGGPGSVRGFFIAV